MQSSRSEALGAPRIPQVKWNEVGGLEEAKRQVINTIQLPLRHPSLVSSKLRRSGKHEALEQKLYLVIEMNLFLLKMMFINFVPFFLFILLVNTYI